LRFREYMEIEEALGTMGLDHRNCDDNTLSESGVASALKKGLLAGAMSLAPFASGGASDVPVKPNRPEVSAMKKVDWKRPRYMKMISASKDAGRYYDSSTERELRASAEEGDKWAVRELPWPKGHRFHELGRPFFRNEKPHPQGLFPSSGL
jgi:hypothetical protein